MSRRVTDQQAANLCPQTNLFRTLGLDVRLLDVTIQPKGGLYAQSIERNVLLTVVIEQLNRVGNAKRTEVHKSKRFVLIWSATMEPNVVVFVTDMERTGKEEY